MDWYEAKFSEVEAVEVHAKTMLNGTSFPLREISKVEAAELEAFFRILQLCGSADTGTVAAWPRRPPAEASNLRARVLFTPFA